MQCFKEIFAGNKASLHGAVTEADISRRVTCTWILLMKYSFLMHTETNILKINSFLSRTVLVLQVGAEGMLSISVCGSILTCGLVWMYLGEGLFPA